MNYIKNGFIKIFKFTDSVSANILRLANNRNLYAVAIILLFLTAGAIFIQKNMKVAIILYIIFFGTLVISIADTVLTSVTGFLGSGLLYWAGFTGLIIVITYEWFGRASYFIFYLIVAVSWWFYCLIADIRVAEVANQIIASALALIALAKDMIMLSIPENILESAETYGGDTVERIIEMAYGLIINPILAVNIISLLLLKLKEYCNSTDD